MVGYFAEVPFAAFPDWAEVVGFFADIVALAVAELIVGDGDGRGVA